MKSQVNNLNLKSRIVGLDAMRAILALFGILMHSGASYMLLFPGFHIPWYNYFSQNSLFFSWLVLWIHSFYMPTFFFLSGFLSYKIYKNRELSGLAFSRLTRIALPFLVIYLAPIIFTLIMSLAIPAAREPLVLHKIIETLKDTGAFWFLYYLFLMDLAALLFLSLKKLFKVKLEFFKHKKLLSRLGLAFFIIAPIVLLLDSPYWFTPVKTSIIPSLSVLSYYGIFFTLGWVIQHQYGYLVAFAKRFWISLMLLSIISISFDLFLFYYHPSSEMARMAAIIGYSVSALTMFLAMLGGCLRLFTSYSRMIQYLSDSSYWLYISQIPIVLFIEGIFSNVKAPLIDKYLITVFLTTGTCLLLYQLIIRKRKMFNYIDCRPKDRKANKQAVAKTV